MYEDTIIIYTTDHGVAVPYSKCTLYDAGIGVSLIIRVPGSKANGEVSESLVSQVDVFPTLCDLIGLQKPNRLQGRSFVNLFSKPDDIYRDSIFAEVNFHTSYEPIRCVRTKRYKYITYVDDKYLKINFSNIDESTPKQFLMNNGLKDRVKFKEALFDLYYDTGERCNLAYSEEYKDILEDMRNRLSNWQIETSDPLINGQIKIQDGWKVNKKECLNPSSKDINDYVNLKK